MKEIKNKEYVFSGELSGELYRSKDLVDMYKTSKEIKEFDRKNYIEDTYYYEIEYENGDKNEQGHTLVYSQEVKIYKRKNKIYCKAI